MQIYYIQRKYAHSKMATFLSGIGTVLVFPGAVGFILSLVSYPKTVYKKNMLICAAVCFAAILIGLVFFHVAEKIGKKAEVEYKKKETASRSKQVNEMLSRLPTASEEGEEE